MILIETVYLIRLLRSLCPAQAIDEHTAEAWQPVLDDIDPVDAIKAVYAIAKNHDSRPLFIDPRQILNQVRATKADYYERHPPETPPPEGPKQYLEWVRGNRMKKNTGTGNVLPRKHHGYNAIDRR
ncbi:hypothetical protein [Cutibacterium sp.]|uniref:hypothetical protein n=1 Tax=Cutibacterium sp. TaxID=1912221 RepID=UPI0026DB3B83|nr:hypothetical protein [Cutibacterium sp.]MDO4413051.1 hypothetical protein [Cutibacterium sp.]